MLLLEDRLDSLVGELSSLLCDEEHSLDSAQFVMYRFLHHFLTSCFILFAALSDNFGGVIICLITVISSAHFFLTRPSLAAAKVSSLLWNTDIFPLDAAP